jgi:hypothetical protein
VPRYVELVRPDPAGIVNAKDLPHPLPFNLAPRDFLRMVEDIQDVLHEINAMMHERGYRRLEELLDPAGFSGMVSRSGVTRLASASHTLVVNQKHNGYPDLLVDGRYPGNAVQHGEGGLEVKASRALLGWQTHGPRAGWFCVIQFELDDRDEIALFDREPTKVRAVLVAEVAMDDWSWQPAGEGRIRSGTASLRASGVVKCRAGAVWIDPEIKSTHDQLLIKARADAFRDDRPRLIEQAIRQNDGSASEEHILGELSPVSPVNQVQLMRGIKSTLNGLKKQGRVIRAGKSWAVAGEAKTPEPVSEASSAANAT